MYSSVGCSLLALGCPQVRHLGGLVSSSEKAFAKLEHDLVTVTKVGGWMKPLFQEKSLDMLYDRVVIACDVM